VRSERDAALGRLADEEFDLLVVGGGITGAGILRDAVLRGLKVALVDKGDFASGTSSKSSKLVHGGLRYLEQLEFALVFEGTNERALLMRVAPHLVRPLEFLFPSYAGDKPGLFVLDVGLWLYDALSKFSSPRIHRTMRARRTLEIEPGLNPEGLKGGLVYFDCMTDDARLTLENILDARRQGGIALNYVAVTSLRKEGERVVGAVLQDRLRPEAPPLSVRAKVVVSAAGPWTDDLRKLDGQAPILAKSKGVHLLVDAARLSVRHAIVMKEHKRVVFVIPWGARTVIGTTDTFYDGRPEDAACDGDDVRYLLDLANRYFPASRLTPDDVLSTWAGLRPLVRPSAEAGLSASDVSREHTILSRPGLVSIAGGKLTTYRRMAAEAVEAAAPQLQLGPEGLPPIATATRPLPGAEGSLAGAGEAGLEAHSRALADGGVVDLATATQLTLLYGVRAQGVIDRIIREPRLGERIDPELPYVLAQVDVAVEEEQAETVVDTLERRLSLLLKARDQGLGAAARIAARMGELLGWSPDERAARVEEYRATVELTRRFRS
jgi:glycerol-3-phosphate dehydrogenase